MEMPRESLLAIRCNPSEMIASDANLLEIPQICCVRASAFNENVLKGAMWTSLPNTCWDMATVVQSRDKGIHFEGNKVSRSVAKVSSAGLAINKRAKREQQEQEQEQAVAAVYHK